MLKRKLVRRYFVGNVLRMGTKSDPPVKTIGYYPKPSSNGGATKGFEKNSFLIERLHTEGNRMTTPESCNSNYFPLQT